MTAVSGAVLTAAQWNTNVRDNLLETAPAKATAAGQFIIGLGANSIGARGYGWARLVVGSSSGFTLTAVAAFTYVNLGGPAVTITTGTTALVVFGFGANVSANISAYGGIFVSGATTIAGNFNVASVAVGNGTGAAINDAGACSSHQYAGTTALTPGSNTFTMQYASNTLNATPTFRNAWLLVIPF